MSDNVDSITNPVAPDGPWGPGVEPPAYGPDSDQPDEQFVPPWPTTRAPGSEAPIIDAPIVPINPWLPGIALLTRDQYDLINRESVARQAAMYFTTDRRCV